MLETHKQAQRPSGMLPPRLFSRQHVPLPERKITPSLPPSALSKWAQALALTEKQSNTKAVML
jgi:hypothetical protein